MELAIGCCTMKVGDLVYDSGYDKYGIIIKMVGPERADAFHDYLILLENGDFGTAFEHELDVINEC